MRRFQDTPAFWRYFGARLKPFTKPLFLGSVGFLSLSGIAIYQYWNHPDWLQNKIEQPLEAVFGSRTTETIPEVAEEDLANLANIDNIELLLQEIEQNQLANSFNSKLSKKKNNPPSTAFTRFKKEQQDRFKNASTSNSNYLGFNNNALNDLLKPPSLTNYRSNFLVKPYKKITSNNSNPLGNLYLSNKKSSLNRTVSSPYIKTSPLSNLGDKSGNYNLRQQRFNAIQNINTPENPGNITNQTRIANPNNRFNQTTNSNNLSTTQSVPEASLNQQKNNNTANFQNRQTSISTNNFNRYVVPTPNYNKSVPNNYQLQPRSFEQQNPRNFNQINYSNNLGNSIQTNNRFNNNNLSSNSTQNQQLNNSGTKNLNQLRQSNNQTIINQFSNPILQPAGSLSTSPLR